MRIIFRRLTTYIVLAFTSSRLTYVQGFKSILLLYNSCVDIFWKSSHLYCLFQTVYVPMLVIDVVIFINIGLSIIIFRKEMGTGCLQVKV